MCWVGTTPSDRTLADFVAHRYGMIASDAIVLGDHPNPRTYGCFPQVLGEYVRKEQRLDFPEAIRKMTSFPAQRLGLPDRGVLRDGMKADIVILDLDLVARAALLGRLRERAQKVLDQVQHLVELFSRYGVAAVIDHLQPGVGNVARNDHAAARRCEPVLQSLHDKRRTADR